jgi:hypothetical protein
MSSLANEVLKEPVADERSDITSDKKGGEPLGEELDWEIWPCETLEGRDTEPGIQDP